jgi:hypothetical protein
MLHTPHRGCNAPILPRQEFLRTYLDALGGPAGCRKQPARYRTGHGWAKRAELVAALTLERPDRA